MSTRPSFSLVLDLETIRDPELAPAANAEPATDVPSIPAAPHHQIVVCGTLLLASPDQDYKPVRYRLDTDEREALKRLIQTLSDRRVQLVTFAGRSFDMPVVMARSLKHGLPFQRFFSRDGGDMRYRYSLGPHIDLMDQMSEWGSSLRPKLGDLVRLFGFPGKIAGDGSKVGEMVAAGRLDEVATYNLEDLTETAALFLRWMRLRGELDAAAYSRASRHLVDFMAREPRLHPLYRATNITRFCVIEDWEPREPRLRECQGDLDSA